ncbi:hypothetical protein KCU75_g14, partial [Aureobasidium melanogenum]
LYTTLSPAIVTTLVHCFVFRLLSPRPLGRLSTDAIPSFRPPSTRKITSPPKLRRLDTQRKTKPTAQQRRVASIIPLDHETLIRRTDVDGSAVAGVEARLRRHVLYLRRRLACMSYELFTSIDYLVLHGSTFTTSKQISISYGRDINTNGFKYSSQTRGK